MSGSKAPGAMLATLLAFGAAACVNPSGADAAPPAAADASTKVTLNDLEWLAGAWSGEALGGQCDESWSSPSGGQITGMFRIVSGGAVRVVELMSIVETESGLRYHFRHFSPDLEVWESEKEKPLSFNVVRGEDGGFVLVGDPGQGVTKMTIRRNGDDEYTTTVEVLRDGQPTSFDVTVKRKASP